MFKSFKSKQKTQTKQKINLWFGLIHLKMALDYRILNLFKCRFKETKLV